MRARATHAQGPNHRPVQRLCDQPRHRRLAVGAGDRVQGQRIGRVTPKISQPIGQVVLQCRPSEGFDLDAGQARQIGRIGRPVMNDRAGAALDGLFQAHQAVALLAGHGHKHRAWADPAAVTDQVSGPIQQRFDARIDHRSPPAETIICWASSGGMLFNRSAAAITCENTGAATSPP